MAAKRVNLQISHFICCPHLITYLWNTHSRQGSVAVRLAEKCMPLLCKQPAYMHNYLFCTAAVHDISKFLQISQSDMKCIRSAATDLLSSLVHNVKMPLWAVENTHVCTKKKMAAIARPVIFKPDIARCHFDETLVFVVRSAHRAVFTEFLNADKHFGRKLAFEDWKKRAQREWYRGSFVL